MGMEAKSGSSCPGEGKVRILIYIALWNIVLGLALLGGWWLGSGQAWGKWEREIYWNLGKAVAGFDGGKRGVSDDVLKEEQDGKLVFIPFYPVREARAKDRVVLVRVEDESQGIFANPPGSLDYAVIFSQLGRNLEVRSLAVCSPLRWPTEDEPIWLSTVLGELEQFELPVMQGVTVSPTVRTQEAPAPLARLAIPGTAWRGEAKGIPCAGKIENPPLLPQNDILAWAPMDWDGEPIAKVSPGVLRIPMVYRWGDQYFPALPLAFVLQRLKVELGELRIVPGDRIWIGDNKYIRIDMSCCARIRLADVGKEREIPAHDLVPPMGAGHPEEVRNAFGRDAMVLVGSDVALAEGQPDNLALQGSVTRMLLDSPEAGPLKILRPLGKAGQWILWCNAAFVGVWMLKLRRRWRMAWLLVLWVGLPAMAVSLVKIQGVWTPLSIVLALLLVLSLLNIVYPQPPDSSPKTDDNEEDIWKKLPAIPRPY